MIRCAAAAPTRWTRRPTARWTFRAVERPTELESIFRLRYRAFAASPQHHEAVGACRSGVDVTRWDAVARHYAVFDEGSGRPIATLRAVGRASGGSEHVEALIERYGTASSSYRPEWLPLGGLFPEPLPPRLVALLERGEHLVEFSRVCVDPDLGPLGPRAFRLLAEGALASEFLCEDTRIGLGLSPVSLVPVYRAYGFERVAVTDGDIEVHLFSQQVPSVLLRLDREVLLARASSYVGGLADELRWTGAIERTVGGPR